MEKYYRINYGHFNSFYLLNFLTIFFLAFFIIIIIIVIIVEVELTHNVTSISGIKDSDLTGLCVHYVLTSVTTVCHHAVP